MFLAVDPGRDTGWATLDATGRLVACGAGEDFPILSNREAVIEKPQVYRQTPTPQANDLITLALRVGRYQERLQSAGVRVELFLPTSWKGSIDKPRHHAQVNATLPEYERAIVERVAKPAGARGYDHNVWDAVAFAKWAWLARWGRTTRRTP